MAEEMPIPLFTSCKLTFSCKVFHQNDNLYKLLTNKLHFMISGFDPLVIEKRNPSQVDICTLFDSVKEFLKVPETFDVPEIQDYSFINNLDDNHREASRMRATGIKIKCEDLKQILSEEAPKVDKQFTKHVRENDDDDGHGVMMSSQQETLFDNDETSTLIKMCQCLDVNNLADDKKCSKESNNEKRSDLFDNEINIGESTQAIHIGSGASSDLSLKQKNDPFPMQIDIKYSLQSHETERENNNNAHEGREHETKLRINRQNNDVEDSLYSKEDKLEHDQELLNKESDRYVLSRGMAYKKNDEIVETISQKAESDPTINNDREIYIEGINKLLSENDTEHAKGFKKPITDEKSSIDTKKLNDGLNMHGMNQREITYNDQENVSRKIKNGKEQCKKETTKQPSEQRLGDEVQNLEHCIDKIGKQTHSRQNETELGEMTPVLHESTNDFNTIEVSESAACNDTRHDHRLVVNKSDLKVYVYKASIIELETDCIVNAANTRLHHNGGVSNAIAGAAGPALTKECEEFINSSNSVGVTEIFVSTGGKLPSNYVIHAVGPKWDYYEDKTKCFEDLRHTVLRCLVEAGRRKMTSIALPSISAAIFKVPKEECARCYMEAVKHFHIFNAVETLTLREIHFVDIDDIMVNYIREWFFKGWSRPSKVETVQKDCIFAIQHLYSMSRNETANYQIQSGHENKSSDHNRTTSLMLLTREPTVVSTVRSSRKSEINTTYQIGKIILDFDVRPAFDQRADFTITIGQPFDKLSGLQEFQIPSTLQRHKDMSYSKKAYKFVDVPKPDSKQSRLVCIVYPEPQDQNKVEEAFKNIEPAIQSSGQNVKVLVLTSSILYDVPSNKHRKKGNKSSIDQKKVSKFAQCLFDFLNKESRDIHVSVVGEEDAVITIKKVLESHCVQITAAGGK